MSVRMRARARAFSRRHEKNEKEDTVAKVVEEEEE